MVNWFTVVAQIINFLILVWLLKKFLYGPVIKAMDEREERIRNRLEKADQKQQKADEEREEYQQKNREWEEKRQNLMQNAKKEADEKKSELVKKAREDADERRRKWMESVEQEKDSFMKALQKRVSNEVFKVTRSLLRDLADTELEENMLRSFMGRLEKLGDDQKQKLADAAEAEDGKAVVRSGFELSEDARKALKEKIHAELSESLDVEFETAAPELICGVEVQADGEKVAWTLEHYLQDLENDVNQTLQTLESTPRKQPEEPENDAEQSS